MTTWTRTFVAVLVLVTVLLPVRADAQTTPLACTVSLSPVAFGSIDVLPGSGVQTSGNLLLSCLNVTLSTGTLYLCVAFQAGTLTATGSATLAYNLLGPSPATAPWSNTTPIPVPFATLQLAQTVTIPVGFAILAGQGSAPPGIYNQTISGSATFGTQSCTAGAAGSSSFSAQVTAIVLKCCNVSATNLGFPSVGDLGSIVDGQSALSVQCSRGIGYTVGLDGGLSGASDPTARQMTGSGGAILYGLYEDAARTVPWGSLGVASLGGLGTAGTKTIPVYGRVRAQPTPPAGSYSDTVVLTITY